MIEVEQHITVARPIDTVYRFVIDGFVPNHPRWDPDVVRMEQLESGDVRIAMRYTMGRRVMGQVQESILEVTECEPDRRVVMTSETRAMSMRFVNAFADDGSGGTRVTFRAEAEPHGPLKMMSPVIKQGLTNGLRRSLENIRTLVEEESSAPAAG